jgi:hypothetical protein
MDWTQILANAGIEEPPGRLEAIEQAKIQIESRYVKQGRKRAKGSTTRKTKKVARVDYKATRHGTGG